MRLAQAGSQVLALQVIDAAAAEFPDALDWAAYRRRIHDYHLPLAV
jgi:hypothetical protein